MQPQANDVEDDAALESARRMIMQQGADAGLLYSNWFHRQTDETCLWPSAAAYAAAALDTERFEPGWQVVALVDGAAGAVVAQRGGQERTVAPPQAAPEEARGLWCRKGTALCVDRLAYGEANGFWHVWSSGWQSKAPEQLQRFYVNVSPPHALNFMASVMTETGQQAVWATKVLCGLHKAGRRDRVLVYLPLDIGFDPLWTENIKNLTKDICDDDLPPFVRPVATGVGWAPDPGGGVSFGQALCSAISSAADHVVDGAAFKIAARSAIQGLFAGHHHAIAGAQA